MAPKTTKSNGTPTTCSATRNPKSQTPTWTSFINHVGVKHAKTINGASAAGRQDIKRLLNTQVGATGTPRTEGDQQYDM